MKSIEHTSKFKI